jgi:hypothetical protein
MSAELSFLPAPFIMHLNREENFRPLYIPIKNPNLHPPDPQLF